jgi:hypothetical protein
MFQPASHLSRASHCLNRSLFATSISRPSFKSAMMPRLNLPDAPSKAVIP